tara:strand:- start:2084 stop:3097 length:1014 start_codon:yes stop_codon:yes gene_type:complete
VKNPKTVKELKSKAVVFWPNELCEKEKRASIIPMLLKTQEKFISILHLADSKPTSWKGIVKNLPNMPANLFLKHLCVLSDIGGERLKRFRTTLPKVLRNGLMEFNWKNSTYRHKLKSLLNKTSWSNKALGTDGIGLQTACDFDVSIEDVCMLLLFGGSAINAGLPNEIEEKCILGGMLGDKRKIEKFVKERYIWVSRITGGATANAMGYLAQNYVLDKLEKLLPLWDFSKKSIPKISQNAGKTDTKFDIVAKSPTNKYWAIEVSFQVTTNSTIERKAGQAKERQRLLHRYGHKIAYIIDGAGNFERQAALQTILSFSDCSGTYSDKEIERLAKTIMK